MKKESKLIIRHCVPHKNHAFEKEKSMHYPYTSDNINVYEPRAELHEVSKNECEFCWIMPSSGWIDSDGNPIP